MFPPFCAFLTHKKILFFVIIAYSGSGDNLLWKKYFIFRKMGVEK